MPNKSNGNVVDQNDWNQLVANFLYLGGTTGDVKTGAYSITGDFYAAGGTVTVGGPAASTGAVRLANAVNVAWRNGGGSGDLAIQADSANRFVFAAAGTSWNTSTSVGAAGGAAAPPASPIFYLVTVVNGNSGRIPVYA